MDKEQMIMEAQLKKLDKMPKDQALTTLINDIRTLCEDRLDSITADGLPLEVALKKAIELSTKK